MSFLVLEDEVRKFQYVSFLSLFLGFVFSFVPALTAQTASIAGRVTDPSSAAVPEATVVLLPATGAAPWKTTTDANGQYMFTGVAPGSYSLQATKTGFANFRKDNLRLIASQVLTVDVALSLTAVGESVIVHGDVLNGVTPAPTQTEVFQSSQSVRVLDRKKIEVLGPVAGAAQIISLTPGADINGYGNTGATKYTITLNGLNQGWGGYGGYTGGGALAVTFDGVPIMDPATGLWQSDTIPENRMVQNATVTYGPGPAVGRWYTNIGGAVEFTPIQPTARPHADVFLTDGSYFQKSAVVNLASGLWNGWSTVLSLGGGSGNDYRRSPDGFKNPAKDLEIFSKTIKTYGDDSFELGGYYAHSGGYRSQVIPTTPQPGLTMDGTPNTVQYSQQTSGFYSTLPYASYWKYDTNDMALIYARQNLRLDENTSLQNLGWFMRIDRTHYRTNDIYSLGPQEEEWNNPHTDTIGDQLLWSKKIGSMNHLWAGGYFLHALYNTRNNFFNTTNGGSKTTVNIGGKVRDGWFDQDDFALLLQDDFRPVSWLRLTPGLRYVGFQTGYSNHVLQDYRLASGVVLSQRDCTNFYSGTPGNTKDQGANCGAQENRSGVEPSIDANILVRPWLTLYGGYQEALKAPQMGGGGGLFQSVDPSSYLLARDRYYQAGFKVHFEGNQALNTFLVGSSFFHHNYANQEIDVTLGNGDTIANGGTSSYHGVNMFIEDDPISNLHLFSNASLQRAVYTSFVTGAPTVAAGGAAYNGLPVPYVPASTFNIGAYYQFKISQVPVRPMVAFQGVGRQAIFNNVTVLPSSQTMKGYGTLNFGLSAPYRRFELDVTGVNLTDNKYNAYEWISSGGYFGTPTSGYILAYPGAPATVFATLGIHF